MNNVKKITIIIIAISTVMALTLCNNEPDKTKDSEPPKINEVVNLVYPDDVAKSCTLSETEFASWFSNGKITENGMVNSANSLDSLAEDCDFYKWSWQMFLWQTSPVNGSYVFDSKPFFDVEGGNLVVNGKMMKLRGGKLTSEGQAGPVSGVLMSQLRAEITPEGSLVYYGIHVNDVYGYFASGKNDGKLKDITEFPTSKAQLDEITKYAKEVYHTDIEDGKSLTMEMKSSWIKTEPGKDYSQYITIKVNIPRFVKKTDKEWTWDGTSYDENVTLALIGYHVVGSTAKQPGMVWATFEHTGNTTDVDYFYTDTSGQVKEKKMFGEDGLPINKNLLFTDGSVKENASNQMHMELIKNSIVGEGAYTISPSSTIRTHPWGSDPTAASAINNSRIISINQNIRSLLLGKDARKNYFLVGTVWNTNGVPGVGDQLPVFAGSKLLANSTMETYQQYKSCYGCHQGGNLGGLSHIFNSIKPIPVPIK